MKGSNGRVDTLSVLVTGGSGQLGRALLESSGAHPELIMHFYDRKGLDITDPGSIAKALDNCQPDLVINTAAYTAVDKAESEPDIAFLINEKGPGLLAEATKASGIPLVHISTDYVFHNEIRRPLREDDPTDPVGVYARSKRLGEIEALVKNDRSFVVRTSWVYGVHGHNFVKTMLRLGTQGRELKVVNDQTGSPTNAHDLAGALLDLAQKISSGEMPGGIYHYSNLGQTSWYGFASRIFELAGMDVSVSAIPTTEYPTPAERPAWSVLDCSKIGEYLNGPIPDWAESLKGILPRIRQEI